MHFSTPYSIISVMIMILAILSMHIVLWVPLDNILFPFYFSCLSLNQILCFHLVTWSLLLLLIHQLGECDIVEVLFHLSHLQQEDVLVAVVRQHLIVNFRYNPVKGRKEIVSNWDHVSLMAIKCPRRWSDWRGALAHHWWTDEMNWEVMGGMNGGANKQLIFHTWFSLYWLGEVWSWSWD